jgi:hypothetical protein
MKYGPVLFLATPHPGVAPLIRFSGGFDQRLVFGRNESVRIQADQFVKWIAP